MTFASVESEQVSNGTYFDKASLIARTMIKQETTDNKSPHVRESRRVLDSGFHTVDSGFQVLDSGFQLSGFRIPKRAGFQIFLCVF